MIRFKCPACQKILKAPDEGAGRKINCPKCGQRMLIPALERPATTTKTMLGQFAPSPAPIPTAPSLVETDSLVLLGLRKDAELKGSSKEQRGYKPARSWVGTLCALAALALTLAATPVAILRHPLIGAGLAAFAVVLALFAVFKSLFRKGLGIASIALMLGGAVLFGIVALSGGSAVLLKPVKDRLAALSQQDPLERKQERPTPAAHMASEAKSETNQPAEKDGRKEERKPQRREEKEKEQSEQSEREAAPAADKTPPKNGPKLDADELREFHRWIASLRTELGSLDDNAIRYRANLQKAEKKAQAYTRDFTAREVALGFDLPVYRIEESHIYLNGNFDVYQVVLKGEGRDGTLSLKVGQDISKDAAIELKRGQTLSIKADVVSASVEPDTLRRSLTSIYNGPYVQITVKNLRVGEGQKKNEENPVQAERKDAEKSKTEDNGQPRFDPNDLQRTAHWGRTNVERLQQDADNAIRHRTTLEKLSKDISVHENAKVRWEFVVASIGEHSVELWADRQTRNFISSRSGHLSITGNGRFGPLSLSVGQGISKEEAAKLKPLDTITVSAEVANLRLDRGSVTIVLKDLQVAEARKQSREESTNEVSGVAALPTNASPKFDLLPPPAPQAPPRQPKPTKAQLQAKAQPPTVDAIVENRLAAGEEELLKQLESVPELRLVNDLEVQALHKSAKGKSVMAELHQGMVKAGIQAGLPLRGGAQAQLSPSAALVVEQLSKSLRDLGFVSGVPSPGSRRGLSPSQENRPLDKVAEFQKWCDDKQIEKANAALPTLLQMLQVEKPSLRLLLVRELAKVNNRDTTIVLTYRALFDLDPEVRALAVKALERRSTNHYLPFLLKGLRYPWPSVADHAAQALRKLKITGIEPQLIKLMEQPDPTAPVPYKKNKKLLRVPELVRLNHMRNCVLCHAPSTGPTDGLVRGLVPTPGQPLPRVYYAGQSGDFIRADTTFLRQDFSVMMTVEGADPWPTEQRFDFVVRSRVVKSDEMPEIAAKSGNNYPQREAVLYALRGLTGKDAGESAEQWREMLGIAKDAKDADQDRTRTDKRPALDGTRLDGTVKVPTVDNKTRIPKKDNPK